MSRCRAFLVHRALCYGLTNVLRFFETPSTTQTQILGQKEKNCFPVNDGLEFNNQVILAGTLTGVQGDIRCKVLVALSTPKYKLEELA